MALYRPDRPPPSTMTSLVSAARSVALVRRGIETGPGGQQFTAVHALARRARRRCSSCLLPDRDFPGSIIPPVRRAGQWAYRRLPACARSGHALKMRGSRIPPEPSMPDTAPILSRRRLLVGGAVVAGGGLVLALLARTSRLPGLPGAATAPAAERLPAGNAGRQHHPAGRQGRDGPGRDDRFRDPAGRGTARAPGPGVGPPCADSPAVPGPEHGHRRQQQHAHAMGPIRRTGAAAREMLRTAAAQRWQVAANEIEMPGDGSLASQHVSTARSC